MSYLRRNGKMRNTSETWTRQNKFVACYYTALSF